MHVLLVGGGGREHALAWKLDQSPLVTRLSATDGNPGFPERTEAVKGDLVAWAQTNAVDLVVVGPEGPLAAGLADALAVAGIPTFGPLQAAARLESSKAFAKAFMDRHRIPTGAWSVHEDLASARAEIARQHAVIARQGIVVKADGLAAGKGVVVADHAADALAAVDEVFAGRFDEAGQRVVLEERLSGREISVLALCDGSVALPMLPCRDHKRRYDDDCGPNTGGMGAVCPPPDLPAGLLEQVRATVLQPVVDGMAAEGTPFRGVLYAGLMLTAEGPRVLEFNVRFGDPECQPLMVMLDEDLAPLLLAAATGELPRRPLRWREGAACCVVVVAGDYPGEVPRGMTITGITPPTRDIVTFFGGVRRAGPALVASGGRVLGVTAHGPSLDAARRHAYVAVRTIHFDTAAWRNDIGGPPLDTRGPGGET